MAITQGIKLDEDIRKRLQALAALRDRSPHWLMKTAIETYLEREERYEQEKHEDKERYEQYQLTGVAVPHEKVTAWLGLLAQGKAAKCPK